MLQLEGKGERGGDFMASILIVDDEPLMRRNLKMLLSRNGYQTAEASDGREALNVVQQSKFDLVITDYKMPGMDGLEFARVIHGERPDLPVFMITAFIGDDIEKAALQYGVKALMTKPVILEELLQKVRQMVAS